MLRPRHRHAQRGDEFARLHGGLLVGQVQVFERQRAAGFAKLQHHFRTQRNQRRHRVADRRAVGDIAAQRAGIADRQRSEALPQFFQFRVRGVQRGIGFFQRHGSADFDHAVVFLDPVQVFDLADVEQVTQLAELLGHPQADVGAAGQDADIGLRRLDRAELGRGARGKEVLALRAVAEGLAALEVAQRVGDLFRIELAGGRRGQRHHALAGVDDRPVAGAAAQVAGQGIADLLARRGLAAGRVLLVQRPQRHHEAGRAEPALGAMALHHGLLHRVERTVRLTQVFHGDQGLAVERGQELDAGIDRLEFDVAAVLQLADDDGTGAAVAFGAAFLGAGAAGVFTQVLQHGAGNGGVGYFLDLAAVEKADGLRLHGLLSLGDGGNIASLRFMQYSTQVICAISAHARRCPAALSGMPI
ncbi:hypothetical protein D3C81_998470 [compost metagenome]